MPNAALLSNARLLAPRLSLASCVRAYVARSTLEAPLAEPAQRLNRFPATPFCAITWFIAGEVEMVAPAVPTAPWRRALLTGPQTRPSISYNPGPARAFMVLLYPQALQALCGIDLPACVDRWMPLADMLGPDWAALSDAVLAAPDDEARRQLVEAFLDPRWQQARRHGAGTLAAGAMAADWVRHLGVQAAAAGWGNGVRNIERRIKAWAGLPMRKLRRLQRAEQSFLDARGAFDRQAVSWAAVASRAGYADQAHFCRETREITGHSPSELARAGAADESYWIYRIWS